jgi:hypothetical protein
MAPKTSLLLTKASRTKTEAKQLDWQGPLMITQQNAVNELYLEAYIKKPGKTAPQDQDFKIG